MPGVRGPVALAALFCAAACGAAAGEQLPSSSSEDCSNPFGPEPSERARLISCFDDASIVAQYDSDLFLAEAVTGAIEEIEGTTKGLMFAFTVQADTGACNSTTLGIPSKLCTLVECLATTEAALGDFSTSLLADPAQLPIGPIKRMCEDCVDAYLSQHIRLGTGPFEGGAGSGAGWQLYCVKSSPKKAVSLLTAGGGGGGGAGPRTSAGSGGGAGMQVLLPRIDPTIACSGGGCGVESDMGETNATGIVKDACDEEQFVDGIRRVERSIRNCANIGRLSLRGGGGAGGGVENTEDGADALLYRFSTGFSFGFGPNPIPGGGGDGNQTCAQLYSTQLCDNAGFPPSGRDSYQLCECPVTQLYSPPPYAYNCTNGPIPPPEQPVTAAEIAANCEEWCPGVVIDPDTNEPCAPLPECANCPYTFE